MMSRNLLTSTGVGGPAILNSDPLSFEAPYAPRDFGIIDGVLPPTGTDNTIGIDEDETYVFTSSDFGFDDGSDGDTLSLVQIATLPLAGSLMWDPDGPGSVSSPRYVYVGQQFTSAAIDAGQLSFVPAADANGPAHAGFTFRVTDSSSSQDPTPNTITFDVDPVNDAPTVSFIAHQPAATGEIRVNTTTAGGQGVPTITTLADGGHVVAWTSPNQDGSASGIYMQRYDASGAPLGGETLVNTVTAGSQYGPAITTLADGNFVIVWQGPDSNGLGLYSQRFDPSGTPLGSETMVNTYTTGDQSIAKVSALAGGGYVVVWESYYQDGNRQGVFLQRFDASGAPDGAETQVNTTTLWSQYVASVTGLANGGFVVTWQSDFQDGDSVGVYLRCYDASGVPLGGETLAPVVTAGGQFGGQVVGLADGNFLVLWNTSAEIHARRFDATGVAISGEVQLTDSADRVTGGKAVALPDGGYVVTWSLSHPIEEGDEEGDTDIYVRSFNADGSAHGPVQRVNTYTPSVQRDPVIAVNADGSYVISWVSFYQDGSLSGVYSQRFDVNFAAIEQVPLDIKGFIVIGDVDAGSDSITVTLAVDSGMLAVDPGTSGAGVDDSNPQSIVITGTLAQIQALLDTDGGSSVTYTADSDAPPATAQFTVTIDDGTDQASATQTIMIASVNDAPALDLDYTDISAQGNDSATAWQEGDTPVALAFAVELDDDNASYDGATVTATFTANGTADDRLTILSVGDGPGEIRIDGTDVYYEGTLVGTVTGGTDGSTPLVVTFNEDACHCAVQLTIGSIAYANASAAPAANDRIVNITLVDGGGTAHGGFDAASADVTISVSGANDAPTVSIATHSPAPTGEVRVNTTTADHQIESAIAALADGGHVVVWASYQQDGSVYGIYMQRYDALGAPAGGETRVNTATFGSQASPAVTTLADGSFVVVWQTLDGSGTGISSQRFDASGTPLGGETQVNTYTADTQASPDVHALAGGGYVVVWESDGQDGDNSGVYMQRFDASGAPDGAETRVNATIANYQGGAAVTGLADGGFVVTWMSFGQDGSGFGIFAQRFDDLGAPVGIELLVNTGTTAGNQYAPSVTGLADGDFLFLWTTTSDNVAYEIHARRIDATGAAVGDEAVFGTGVVGSAKAAALPDGGYVITWVLDEQTGEGSDIHVRTFDADGNPTSPEQRVNGFTANDQSDPAIAVNADGSYVVSWTSFGQDGSGRGIYSQTFDANFAATEQVPLDLKGHIAIGDVDAGSDIISVILEVSEGVLAVDPGTSGVSVDDSDQQYIVLTGTLAQLQDLLGPNATSSVTYTYDDDFLPYGPLQLAVTVNDGIDNTTDTVTIDLTPVNDAALLDLDMYAPGNDAAATYVAGDPATPIAYDATFDDDNTDWDGATLTIAIAGATADDQLSIDDMLTFDTTVTGNDIYYDGDLIGTFTGGTNGDPLVITFNALACACAVEEVAYAIAYSNSDTGASGTRDISFTFVDGDGTANGGEDTATATVELTITAGPTPPLIDEGAAATGIEATAIALTGITITDDGDPVTGLITVQLSVAHGTITIRTDVSGGVNSSNIVNSASGHGITIIGTPDQINATLAATNGLTYTGDSGFTGADELTIRANDGTPDTPLAITELSALPFGGAYPSAVAFHDLDGDQLDDLILGAGDPLGTDPGFILILADTIYPVPLTAGTAQSFTFGDYDGDGIVDIGFVGVTRDGSDYVAYLSSLTGDIETVATVPYAYAMVSADFDGNGLLDFAAVGTQDGNLAIILQTAVGTFAAPVFTPATAFTSYGVAAGDFNGDGALDLLKGNFGSDPSFDGPGTVELFTGNGDGSFAASTEVSSVPANVGDVVVADFNNDGFLDYAFSTATNPAPGAFGGVYVVLGNGDGTFSSTTGYVTSPAAATGLTVGDLNGDGIDDILVTNAAADGAFSVLIGNGDGSFQDAVEFETDDYPYLAAIGDPDGDGDLDIMVGTGEGTFEAFNNDGIARGSTATKGITVNVRPPNVTPIATNLNAAQTYVEDTRLRLTTIAITDPDAGDTITATLTLNTIAAGTLSTGTSGLVTSSYDAATGVWTASGAIADVNFLLNKVQFQPAANFNGDFSIATSISDGVAPPVTGTKNFTGTAVNDAPSGADAAYGVSRGVNHVVTASEFGFTDTIDGHDFAGVTLTTLPATGRLYLDGGKVSAGQVISAADIIAGKLVYQPMPGAGSPLSASFTFQVHDNGGTASGGIDTDRSANTLTYNVVSRAPTGADSTVTVTIGAGHVVTLAEFGFNDADGNAFASVTITTLPASGRFLYSASGGPGVPVTTGQLISAADIAAGKLVFKPAGATASFTFQVHDDGGTAFSGADTDATPNTMTFSTGAPTAPHVEDDMALVTFALGSDAILPDHGFSDPIVFEGPVTRSMLLHDVASHAALVVFDDGGDTLGALVDAIGSDAHLSGLVADDDASAALYAHIPVTHGDFFGL